MLSRCLNRERHSGENDAQAEPNRKFKEDPTRDAGTDSEKTQQSETERGEDPTNPDCPAIFTGFGNGKTGDHGAGSDGEGVREDSNAADDGRIALDGLEIEWHKVKSAPEHETLNNGTNE